MIRYITGAQHGLYHNHLLSRWEARTPSTQASTAFPSGEHPLAAAVKGLSQNHQHHIISRLYIIISSKISSQWSLPSSLCSIFGDNETKLTIFKFAQKTSKSKSIHGKFRIPQKLPERQFPWELFIKWGWAPARLPLLPLFPSFLSLPHCPSSTGWQARDQTRQDLFKPGIFVCTKSNIRWIIMMTPSLIEVAQLGWNMDWIGYVRTLRPIEHL